MLDVQNGFAFDSDFFSENDGMPLIRIRDLKEGTFTDTKYKGKFDESFRVKKGDYLIGMDGEFRCYKWKGEDALLNQRVCRLVNFDKSIFPEYIFYGINLHLAKIERNTAFVTVKHISSKQIKKIKFPFPSLQDQIRIANILSKAEALISQRKESLRLLDEFLKSTFLEMFGDPFRGKNLTQLGKHLKLQQGYAFKSVDFIDAGIPVIKIGTVNKGYFDLRTLSYLGDDFRNGYDAYRIRQGDLLISLTGTVGKDDYANTCFVPNIFDFYLLNQRVAKLIPDEKFLLKPYVDFLFKYPDFKRKLIKSNRGVRQANLGNNDIYSIAVSIPAIKLQTQFAHIVEKTEALKAHYQTSLQELENLYGSLSQQAFSSAEALAQAGKREVDFKREELAMAAEPEVKYRKR